MQKISMILSDRETKWTVNQNVKLKIRIEPTLKKAGMAWDYTKELLQDCKFWGGPCTTVSELHNVWTGKDSQAHNLRTEMVYYARTYKADKICT